MGKLRSQGNYRIRANIITKNLADPFPKFTIKPFGKVNCRFIMVGTLASEMRINRKTYLIFLATSLESCVIRTKSSAYIS